MVLALRRRTSVALVICAVAVVVLALWWGQEQRTPGSESANARAGGAASTPSEPVSLAAAWPLPASAHDLPALRARLASGPLAHSTPDGSLPCAAEGLAPSIEVRRRFDWYSQALAARSAPDRLDAADIEALLAEDAQRACGERAAQQIRLLWRGYTAIAADSGARNADLRARAAALRAAQQAQLGPLWADAFFGDDHRALEARLGGAVAAGAAAGSAAPASPSASAQASAAVAELQARWADFDRRIAEAGREWQALAAQGAATPAQADALLNRWFSADERVRASALLNLPV
ncbi:hypothetical protein IP84_08895 [beta proteobacterium AAP99]|nr:hypothetical protein IP84_08895 [beta proteobacterium AAP99]